MSIGSLNGTLSVPLQDPVSESLLAAAQARSASIAEKDRNQVIDAIRLFAAAGIVFVHAAESLTFDKWGNLFRFGVPFFLFASLYFQSLSLRRHPERSLRQFILTRVERLYLPFVVWSLLYLLARDVERLFVQHLPPIGPRLSMLWTGTEYHLWFLPFLLAWTVLLAVLYRGMIERDHRCRWFAIATALTVACAVASLPLPRMPFASEMTFDDPTYAYTQWLFALPAACGALAFACFVALGSTIYTIPASVGWAGMMLVAGCSLKQALHGIELAPRALTGLGTMLVSLTRWESSAIPALARLGRKGYGIYLCHVFPVELIHLILHRLHLAPTAWLDMATFSISFLGAWAIVVLLGKSRRLSWLNG